MHNQSFLTAMSHIRQLSQHLPALKSATCQSWQTLGDRCAGILMAIAAIFRILTAI